MPYKRLFIWVEGEDDARFFNRIIKSRLERKYNLVEVRTHSGLKREKINNFLKSIKAMNADYIYVRDINNAPCITAKKQKIQGRLRYVDEANISIVIKEIESWYLAGISDKDAKKIKIHSLKVTDNVTKEQFNKLIPKKFDSRIDFMLELLKLFSIDTAKQKNKSFNYFVRKYNFNN